MTTTLEGIGFLAFLLGASAIESACIWIPVAVMTVGVLTMMLGMFLERR